MATKRKYEDGPAVIFPKSQARPAREMAELIAIGLRARGYPQLEPLVRKLGIALTGIVDPFAKPDRQQQPKLKRAKR